MTEYRWIEQEEYDKIIGQFKLSVGETLSAFDFYGLGALIPGAIKEIESELEVALQKLRGKYKPYSKIKRIYRRER